MFLFLRFAGGLLIWLAPLLLLFPFITQPTPATGGALRPAADIAIESLDEPAAFLQNERNTVDVVSAVGPSVAAIDVSVPGEPISSLPPEELPPELRDLLPYLADEVPFSQSAGSGFLVNFDGHRFLVTNYHVVREALQPGTTRLNEGASLSALFPGAAEIPIPLRVVGANPSFDLALLAGLESSDSFGPIPGIDLANSDQVRVGQKSVAIGNPFGLEFTVTTGIVSAVQRFAPSIGRINVPMIQTDAAINPGNSGGPLLNSQGQLIGVNTLIINPEGRSSAGLGFAVPSNLLLESFANLELGGLSDIGDTRPTFGVHAQTISVLPKGIRELLSLPDEGVLIIDVLPGGPAHKAGLRGSERVVEIGSFAFETGGDVITAVNGVPLQTVEQLNVLVAYEGSAGDWLQLDLLREGRRTSAIVTLELLP